MSVEHVIAFNVALLAAILSPGPAFLVATRATFSGGRAAGVATGFGLGLIAAAWTGMALLGLDGIFRVFPWAYAFMKTAGALYLLYMAWKTWRSARHPIAETARPTAHAFRDGVLINLANPKSVLFAAAVLIVVFPADTTLLEKSFIVANHFVFEISFYALLAAFMSATAARRAYLRLKAVFDRFAAVVLGFLGLRLLMQR